MYRLGLEKAKEPEIKLSTFVGSLKKHEPEEYPERMQSTFCFVDYTKAFDCVNDDKLENS